MLCLKLPQLSVENMGFLALSSVAFDVLRGISWAATLSFPFVNDGLAVMINFMNNTVAERAYSRKLETEADKLGLQVFLAYSFRRNECLTIGVPNRSLLQLDMIQMQPLSSGSSLST